MRTVKSQEDIANYLEKQPKSPSKMTFMQAMDYFQADEMPIKRLPYSALQKLEVPTF